MSTESIDTIYHIGTVYYFYANIFILSIGVIGNFCLILIFVSIRAFRGNQCTFYLTIESISNIGLLLTTFVPYIYSCVTGQNPSSVSLIWCKFQSAMAQVFGLTSLFTICFLTFDQFLSTNPRPSWRHISTLKLAYRLTLGNICFVILRSIPFFILSEIRTSVGCVIYNTILLAYFTFFYYPFLNSTIPIIITVTFSLLAYRNVRRIIRRQINVDRRRLDRQLTAMALTRVICIVSLGVPYIICVIYDQTVASNQRSPLQSAIFNLIYTIAFTLLFMNFAINFFLYLIVSPRFRRQMKSLIIKKYWHAMTVFCRMRTSHTHRNQITPATAHGPTSCIESVA